VQNTHINEIVTRKIRKIYKKLIF